MQRKNVIIAIVIMALWVSSVLAQGVPFSMERNKTIVPVTVGKSRELRVVLDTGMSFDGLLIYNPALKDSLELENTMPVQVPGAGGGEPSEAIMADSAEFSLHGVRMQNQRILVLSGDNFKGFPSDGVIGYSVFGHYAVELNYDNSTMQLHPPGMVNIGKGWSEHNLYFKKNTIPWIDIAISVDGGDAVPVSVYIDFASGEAIELLDRTDMKYPLPEETEKAYLGRGLSGDIYGKRGKITALHIGPHTLTQVTAAIAPAAIRSKQENADAVLGNNALRRFNVIFDYMNHRLYLKPNKHFNEPF